MKKTLLILLTLLLSFSIYSQDKKIKSVKYITIEYNDGTLETFDNKNDINYILSNFYEPKQSFNNYNFYDFDDYSFRSFPHNYYTFGRFNRFNFNINYRWNNNNNNNNKRKIYTPRINRTNQLRKNDNIKRQIRTNKNINQIKY